MYGNEASEILTDYPLNSWWVQTHLVCVTLDLQQVEVINILQTHKRSMAGFWGGPIIHFNDYEEVKTRGLKYQ